MKQINKEQQPEALIRWRAENAAIPENLKYNKGGFPRSAVLGGLLREQGDLCAYTLKQINASSAHIEHLKPQRRCNADDAECVAQGKPRKHEDIAWNNMVACFPSPNMPRSEYGAHFKEDWWDIQLFVSPLSQNCGQRFHYKNDGSVGAAIAGDAAVKETIDHLNLDNDRLRELRKRAILEAGVHPLSKVPVTSIPTLDRLIHGWGQRFANHRFAEFCIVLIQAAVQHRAWLQRQAQRRRAIRGN